MKNFLLLIFLMLSFGLSAQTINENQNPEKSKLLQSSPKLVNMINKFSITATLGTPSFSSSELNKVSGKKMANVSMADLNIAYKMNSKLSFGIGLMGNLGNCSSGYYTAEGVFTSFSQDDDDNDDEDEIDLEEDDDDDDDVEEEENCEEDEMGNLLGTITYKISENLPLFFQAAGGYSFGNNAPVYSAMIGYNQKIYAGLGVILGIRYSDVIYKAPADATSTTASSGFKAELGLSWNF